jgi:neutral ceramidase
VLTAGVASRDITPELRGDFFGYVRPDLRARGVALRLFAHALVLDDGHRRIALLTLDLGAPLVTSRILERLAAAGFDPSNLLVAATHTHAAPNRPGPWIATQAADAVLAADAARVPARAAWGEATVLDANHNRSLEAHLANHGLDLYPGTGTVELDPEGADHPRDTTVRVLRVDADGGRPLTAWAQFSAHPTTFGPANTYFSADFPRAAILHFRASFSGEAPAAIVTNGTEGDLIPRYDDVNQHALADRIGRRVAGAMRRAWDAAHPVAGLTVDGAGTEVTYRGQEVEPGKRVAARAWFGLPFLGGAENGPSFLYGLGLEGKRRPRLFAGAVHGRKLRVVPAPHHPRAEVTVLRVGDRLLLGVPGEPSVEAGRRMCAAVLAACPGPVGDAMVVGLAYRYRGYFTTPEEYEQQHYEGGHTVYGKHTSLLVQHAHTELAATLGEVAPAAGTTGPIRVDTTGGPIRVGRHHGRAADPHGSRSAGVESVEHASGPPDAAQAAEAPAAQRRAAGRPPFGPAASRLRIVEQPPAAVERHEVVQVAWRGARRGHDRPVGTAFLVLQHQAGATWEDVEDDLGLGFVWRQRGRRASARYEVPVDLPVGRYRLELRGRRARTVTTTFTVVPSTSLRVRGVMSEAGRLRFLAQHPPPDPVSHLRARDPSPRGGTVRFLVDGTEHEAVWDDEAAGWIGPAGVVGDSVQVPEGGLRDGSGNRSGGPVDLVVGRVLPLDWPPAIGPGGGRSPGLFGLGPAGQVQPWPPPERAGTSGRG